MTERSSRNLSQWRSMRRTRNRPGVTAARRRAPAAGTGSRYPRVIRSVFGGGRTSGMMGVVSGAVLGSGGEAHGVITEALRVMRIRAGTA